MKETGREALSHVRCKGDDGVIREAYRRLLGSMVEGGGGQDPIFRGMNTFLRGCKKGEAGDGQRRKEEDIK